MEALNYVNAVTLAKSLGISKVTLYNLIKHGELPPGVKIGRCRRWSVAQVSAWLDGKTQKGAEII